MYKSSNLIKIRKEVHKLSVNSLRVVGVCINHEAMLHHALYYCVFVLSLWNLDLKWRNAASRGVAGG